MRACAGVVGLEVGRPTGCTLKAEPGDLTVNWPQSERDA